MKPTRIKPHSCRNPSRTWPDGVRILVTGGAGFIGSHLVEQLVSAGARVTVVDNLVTGHIENLHAVRSSIEFLRQDIHSVFTTCRLRLEDYTTVFHLAANPYIPPSVENPAYDYRLNLENTFRLLEALRQCRKPPRLVNTSSAAVYGNPVTLPMRETDVTIPISPYGVSKLAAERYVAVFSELYGLQTVSLRVFSVFGPRQRKQVVFDLLTRLKTDPSRLTVLGNGRQARDFGYVGDVVQAMLLAATRAPACGETYNVASGTTTTIAKLATALCNVCQVSPQIKFSGHIRPGDAERWEVDISKLKKLGYNPHTFLTEGLTAILKWYDRQEYPARPARRN